MQLLHYPHAPYSKKVLLAAYEKQVPFEGVICAPFIPADKAKLKAIHPLGTVPLLVDGKEILTESSIIVEYFDLAADRLPHLVPRDPRAALRARALDRFGDSHLMGPTAYLAWATRKPAEGQNHDKIKAQRTIVDVALGQMNGMLAETEFLAGPDLTMADLSPACAISSMLVDRTIENLAAWPHVSRWYAMMTSRPSYLSVEEECRRVPLPAGF